MRLQIGDRLNYLGHSKGWTELSESEDFEARWYRSISTYSAIRTYCFLPTQRWKLISKSFVHTDSTIQRQTTSTS